MTNANPLPGIQATDLALLLGRLLLALIFVHEGLSLSWNFSGAAEAMAKIGIGTPLLLATIALQLAAGLSVASGLLARQNELLHFEKDFAIAGGMFVLAASGAGSLSFDGWMQRRRT
jgi:putative oxidoreductase